MVQKSQKRGVHSGNTLRASDCRYNRRYKDQSCLVRNIKGVPSDTILDDLDIKHDGIEYSLNKKARWALPQILKEHILLRRHHTDDAKIQLTEQHKIKRSGNCIGYYASKGFIRKVIPRQKTYFDVSSVRPKPKAVQTSTETSENSTEINNESDESYNVQPAKEENITPEVNVDIYYPSPTSSSITHNPKYIRYGVESTEPSKLTQLQGKHKKTNRRKQKLQCDYKTPIFDEHWQDGYDDEETDDDEDIYDDDLNEYIYSTSSSKLDCFTAADVIKCARKIHVMSPSSTRTLRNSIEFDDNRKERQIYVENSEPEEQDVSSDNEASSSVRNHGVISRRKYPSMEPVKVLLSREETQPEYLKFIFEDKYIECKSFPRSFIIDISQNVKSAACNFEHLRDRYYKTDFTSCLVFTYDMFTECPDSNNCDVFNVYLNTALKQECVRIETLHDFFHGSIHEIIHRVCFFFETLDRQSFYKLTKLPIGKAKTNFDTLKSSHDISTDSYCLSYGDAYREAFRERGCSANSISASGFELVPPTLCYICFEPIGEGGQDALSLENCGHWFCKDCWREHAQERIGNGLRHMKCPEYGCDETMTLDVLLQIVNIRQLEQYIKRVHDFSVDKEENSKWCPNPECGRVIKATKPIKYLNVTCKCGTEVCFDCLQPAHWPAPCELSNKYRDTLKKKGHDVEIKRDVKTVKVLGKCCPVCKQFIQKDGGCFYMTCVCGANFCWGCLKEWAGHEYGAYCYQERFGDKFNTKLKILKHEGFESTLKFQSEPESYKTAVNNRTARQKYRMSTLKTGVRSWLRKVKSLSHKQECSLAEELAEYIVPGNEAASLMDKLSSFLNSMVLLYVELHHLGEYSAVYLSQCNKRLHRSLQEVIERLETLATSIFDNIKVDSNKEICAIVKDLWDIRAYSVKTVNGLVKLIEH